MILKPAFAMAVLIVANCHFSSLSDIQVDCQFACLSLSLSLTVISTNSFIEQKKPASACS